MVQSQGGDGVAMEKSGVDERSGGRGVQLDIGDILMVIENTFIFFSI